LIVIWLAGQQDPIRFLFVFILPAHDEFFLRSSKKQSGRRLLFVLFDGLSQYSFNNTDWQVGFLYRTNKNTGEMERRWRVTVSGVFLATPKVKMVIQQRHNGWQKILVLEGGRHTQAGHSGFV
jgi:hypothetical protein